MTSTADLENEIARSQAARDEAHRRFHDNSGDTLALLLTTGGLMVMATAIASLLAMRAVPSGLIEWAGGLGLVVCVGVTVRRFIRLFHLAKTAVACDEGVSSMLDRRRQVVEELNQGRPVRIERSTDTD